MIPWPEPSGILLISDSRAAFKLTPSCVTFTSYKPPPPPQNQASLLPADARACAISWHLASNLCMAFTRSLRRNLISTVPAGSSTPPLRDEKDKTECLVCSVLIAYIYKRSWPWIYLPPVDEVFQAFRLKYCVVVLYIFFLRVQAAGAKY